MFLARAEAWTLQHSPINSIESFKSKERKPNKYPMISKCFLFSGVQSQNSWIKRVEARAKLSTDCMLLDERNPRGRLTSWNQCERVLRLEKSCKECPRMSVCDPVSMIESAHSSIVSSRLAPGWRPLWAAILGRFILCHSFLASRWTSLPLSGIKLNNEPSI